MKFAALPADWIEKILGEFYLGGLACWIISTYKGDLQAIKNLIENETACIYARSNALASLVGIFGIGKLPRKEAMDYLKQLLYSDLARDYEFASWVVSTACHLYPEELYADIIELYEKKRVDPRMLSIKNINDALDMGKEAHLTEWVYTYKFHMPITDVFEHLSSFIFDDEEKEAPCDGKEKFNKCEV